MARHRAIASCLVAAAASLPAQGARATDLLLGAQGSVGYDSNVNRTDENPKDDGIATVGPTVRLRDESGTVQYDFYYEPAWKQYFTTHGLSDDQHFVDAHGSWSPDARTTAEFSNRFYYVSSVVNGLVASGGELEPTATIGQEKYKLNDTSFSAVHLFTPRLRGIARLSYSLFEPNGDSESPSNTLGGDLSSLYAVTPSDRVGVGFGLTRQHFDNIQGPSTNTQFYQWYGQWDHDFDPTLSFSISAGPTLVNPDDIKFGNVSEVTPIAPSVRTIFGPAYFRLSSCPQSAGEGRYFNLGLCSTTPINAVAAAIQQELEANGVPAADAATEANDQATALANETQTLTSTVSKSKTESDLTYFASAMVTKKWRTVSSTLAYRRSAGQSSGFEASNIIDTVTATVEWQPTPLWYVSLVGRYDRREVAGKQQILQAGASQLRPFNLSTGSFTVPDIVQLSDFVPVEIDASNDLQDYAVFLYGQRRLTRRFSTFARASFYQQKTTGDFNSENDYKDFQVSLGFRFEFDPINVPFL